MYRLFFCTSLLVSLSSFAQNTWETPLCLRIFNNDSTGTYTTNVHVISTQNMQKEEEFTELQAAQLIAFAFYDEEYQGTLTEAIESFDSGVTYTLLVDAVTGQRYQHIAGYRGDTDASGLFNENHTMPVAFTGDGDCYQDL